ncbi:MAG: hypothetical protein AAB842_03070 [Patescibacteria group bacterium]
MTVEELMAQIEALETQLKSLMQEVEESKIYQKTPENITETKNYEHFLKEAEGSFLKEKYLEAFLIQSCIVEGVLKEYAAKKLLSIISQNPALENKFKNFELARLTDELLIAGKIEKDLYEKLSKYRKKRNDVIHGLLKHESREKLDEELKEAYVLGKNMKGFIVDNMNEEIGGGLSVVELEAQVNALLVQLRELQSQLR